MLTSSYRYELPQELIAKVPVDPPDAARLLVLRADGSLEHRRFADFPNLLERGEVLAINETQVERARLHGRRLPGGGAAEVLLLRPLDAPRFDPAARRWEALVRPGRRLREGKRVAFGYDGNAEITRVLPDGTREIVLDLRVPLETLLAQHGSMPLPPYVGPGDEKRATRYQTIFARTPGSVAAPTASLHFTERVLEALRKRGVYLAPLELDIGYATFKPIESESLTEHTMHDEYYAIPTGTAAAIREAKRAGRRVVAAGTTTLRALESAAQPDGSVAAASTTTSLFVTPGFRFRVVDALLTNFHLPASSLLVLVAAFAGYERIRAAYTVAIEAGYRFYSFGDAMLIERGLKPE